MNGLIDFLFRHNHWLLFIVLEAVSLVLLFSFNDYQGSVWLSSASGVSGHVLETKQHVGSYFGLRSENERLTEQNARLQEEVYALRERIDSTELMRMTEETRRQWTFGVIPATVIENSISLTDNYITIDKGTRDGLRPDMGVISSEGVVGVTFKCSAHYSLILPVLHSSSNISCKVIPGDSFGYLQWTGGDARQAMLRDVPRYASIHVGDHIVTSGHSSFFPEGIEVGTIDQFEPSADNLSNNITVALSTPFSRLRHVFVITNEGTDERKELKRMAEDKKKH